MLEAGPVFVADLSDCDHAGIRRLVEIDIRVGIVKLCRSHVSGTAEARLASVLLRHLYDTNRIGQEEEQTAALRVVLANLDLFIDPSLAFK